MQPLQIPFKHYVSIDNIYYAYNLYIVNGFVQNIIGKLQNEVFMQASEKKAFLKSAGDIQLFLESGRMASSKELDLLLLL